MDKLFNRLNEALRIKGKKQADIVRACKVSRATVSQWTKGLYEPKANNVKAICDLLDIQEAWLLGYDVPMERDDSNEARLVEMYSQLDDIDKGIILGQMMLMLGNEKYKKENTNIG